MFLPSSHFFAPRVTPDLLGLGSPGRATGIRLKRISQSTAWGPEVCAAAASIFRNWKATSNAAYGKGASAGGKQDENGNASGKHVSARTAAAAAALGGAASRNASSAGDVSPSSPTPAPGSRSKTGRAGSTPEETAVAARPRLVPHLLWSRLSREFNPSQLRAVWAAAASAGETRQELERERRAAGAAGAAGSAGGATGEGGGDPSEGRHAGRGDAAGRTRELRVAAEGGVVLLQGPPGTGKTRTVLGVVSAILARQKEAGAHSVSNGAAGGAAGFGASGRGMGTTQEVGTRQKRPGVASRLAAAKTHQRVRFGERVGQPLCRGDGWGKGGSVWAWCVVVMVMAGGHTH